MCIDDGDLRQKLVLLQSYGAGDDFIVYFHSYLYLQPNLNHYMRTTLYKYPKYYFHFPSKTDKVF